MTKETKYINLADFKAVSDGPGGWEGYLSKFGELDDGGDIVLQGAYTDTIPQFLSRGFNAESHDWTFSRLIGFPTKATEDKTGLYTVSQYHSTPDAQLVRTKAQERIAAGMGVYMSIGYEPTAPPIFISSKDYAEQLPQYSSPELVQSNLAKATKFPRVRILPKVELYEGSIVSLPMLRSAEVTSVKSAVKAASHKGAFEAAIGEQEGSLAFLCNTLIEALESIDMAEDLAEDLGQTYDVAGATQQALSEFNARVLAAMMADDDVRMFGEDVDTPADDADNEMAGMGEMSYSGRLSGGQRKNSSLVNGPAFSAGVRAVVHAATRVTEWAEKRYAMRTKEGRVLSAANMSELDDLKTQLATLASKLEKLLAGASPKPKEGDNAEKEKSNQLIQDAILAIVRRDSARRGVTTR